MPCPRCGAEHSIVACPFVKAVEFEQGIAPDYVATGAIVRIEFLTPADYGPRAAAPAEPEPQEEYPRMGPRK